MIKNGYLVCPCLIGGSILTYKVTSQNDSSKNEMYMSLKLTHCNQLLLVDYVASYDSKGYKTLDENHDNLHAFYIYLPRKT